MGQQEQDHTASKRKEARIGYLVRFFKDVPWLGPLYVRWLNNRFQNDPRVLATIDFETRGGILRDLVRTDEFFLWLFGKTAQEIRQSAFSTFGLDEITPSGEEKTDIT